MKSSPIADMAPRPRTIGAITPTVATCRDVRPTLPSSPQVHLEADVEQEQDHPDLAEGAEDLVSLADGVEHRWPDDDAGHDLADDGGDAETLGDLGGHLGGDEDDQDVAKDLGGVHAAVVGSEGRERAPGGHGRAVPARSEASRISRPRW